MADGPATCPADGLVAGMGRIDGGRALAAAEDFTTLGRLHRQRRRRQALPTRADLAAAGAGAARVHARGRRAPADQRGRGPPAQRPPGAGRPVGSRADGVPGARAVGRARRADRAALRLRGDDRAGVAVHRGAAAREGGHRRGRHQGGARRARRCTSTSPGSRTTWCVDDDDAIDRARALPLVLPASVWDGAPRRDGPDTGPPARRHARPRSRPNPRRPYSMRDVARTTSSTRRACSRSPGPASGASDGDRAWPASAVVPWPSSPTTRPSSPGPSTGTARRRPRTSSTSPARSSSRGVPRRQPRRDGGHAGRAGGRAPRTSRGCSPRSAGSPGRSCT